MDFKTYCLDEYMNSLMDDKGNVSFPIDEKFYKTLVNINQRFLEQVLNDSSHPLHNSPDLYCLYQLLLCYEKKSRKVLWLDTILILLIS